jgi:N-acetylglucosamine malate deacetylase 2
VDKTSGEVDETAGPCLLIAPHPDDETIGAGIWMMRHGRGLTLVHITDGSPLDGRDAHRAGFDSPDHYARARRAELYDALALAGIRPEQCVQLGVIDQQTYLHLPAIVERLCEIALRLRAALLMSPAYEGGHPDHDSAAFAAAVVRRRLGIRHREYRLYHSRPDGSLETDHFLLAPDVETEAVEFSAPERELKIRMLRAFRTQAGMLRQFQS